MSNSSELKIGVARSDVSPDKPELLKKRWGRNVFTRGVLIPIFIEALSIVSGNSIYFIITSDLILTLRDIAERVRKAVSKKTGCDPLNIIFSAVHNHSSMYQKPKTVPPQTIKAQKEYDKKIENGYIQACLDAYANIQPSEIAAASVILKERIGDCRRMQLSNGTCITAWGSGPVFIPGLKFAYPSVPQSKQIDILSIRKLGTDKPFAILTSYSSHIHLVKIPYFDGEAAGAMKKEIEARIPGVTALYTNATGGNIDMHRTTLPRPHTGKVEDDLKWYKKSADILAKRFANAVVPAIPTSGYSRPQKIYHKYYDSQDIHKKKTMPRFLIHAMVLGNIALVNLQGELFLEYGIQMHQRCPFPHLLLLGYNETGRAYGYVGTPLDYERGGFEIKGRIPRSAKEKKEFIKAGIRISLSTPQTGKIITDKIIELLNNIKKKI